MGRNRVTTPIEGVTVVTASAPHQTASVERKRRYRQRQRDGIRVVSVLLHHDVIDDLIERRLLAGWNEREPQAVAEAVRTALDQWRKRRDASR